jgi:hypothetical protein
MVDKQVEAGQQGRVNMSTPHGPCEQEPSDIVNVKRPKEKFGISFCLIRPVLKNVFSRYGSY